MDCSPTGSSDLGIFQARILEQVVISFSRGSSQPRDHRTHFSIGRQILSHCATWEVPKICQRVWNFNGRKLCILSGQVLLQFLLSKVEYTWSICSIEWWQNSILINNLFDCCAKRSRCKTHVATEREVQAQRQLTKSWHQRQIIKEPKQHSPAESAMDKEATWPNATWDGYSYSWEAPGSSRKHHCLESPCTCLLQPRQQNTTHCWFKQQKCVCFHSWKWKSEIKVGAVLVSPEVSLLGV